MFGLFNKNKSVEKQPEQSDTPKPVKKEFDGEIVCIYCCEKFSPDKVCFRCPKDRLDAEATFPGCAYKIDDKLNIYREKMGLDTSRDTMSRVIELSEISHDKITYDRLRTSVVNRIECECGKELSDFHRICPHCHNKLLMESGYKEIKMISVVGASAVGKSNYIFMLAKVFEKIAPLYKLSFNILNEYEGENIYKKWITNLKRHEIVQRTPHKERFDPVIIAEMGFEGDRPKMVFVFHDIPGECFVNIDNAKGSNWKGNYVNYSDGIIFLVDPMQIEDLSSDLKNVVEGMFFEYDIQNIPSDIIQNMERSCQGIKEGNRITIPAAITVAKSDILESLDRLPNSENTEISLIKGSNIFRPCNHNGKLKRQELLDVNSEVTGFINKVDKALYSNVISYFKNYSFFAVSAFGKNPYEKASDDGVQLSPIIDGDPEPKRVEEPFLWLLYMMGIIDME